MNIAGLSCLSPRACDESLSARLVTVVRNKEEYAHVDSPEQPSLRASSRSPDKTDSAAGGRGMYSRRSSSSISIPTRVQSAHEVHEEENSAWATRPRSRAQAHKTTILGQPIEVHTRLLDVDGEGYSMIICIAVMLNALLLGLETERGTETWTDILEMLFSVFFSLEIAVRLFEKRLEFFTDVASGKWNIFDLVVTLLTAFEILVEQLLGTTDRKRRSNLRSLTQALKLIRLMRVLRLLRVFRELAIIADGFFKSLESVAWVSFMMSFVIYICALITTSMLGKSPNATDEVKAAFGGVFISMFSLFGMVTLDGWSEITLAVVEGHGWGWGVFFCVYVMMTAFTFMGLLTAVITDQTMRVIREDQAHRQWEAREQRREIEQLLKDLFAKMDGDQSREVSKAEMIRCLNMEEERMALRSLGWFLNHHEVEQLFDTLDKDNSGLISQDEFVQGFSKLRGLARAKDLFTTTHVMLCGFQELEADVESLDQMIRDRAGKASPPLSASSDTQLQDTLRCIHALGGEKSKLRKVLLAVADALDEGEGPPD